jgi:dihydroxyacid dehydratase/phosphogluconate dehydratase
VRCLSCSSHADAKVSGSANTMSSALEVLGMSLPYSSSTPALYPGPISVLTSVFAMS